MFEDDAHSKGGDFSFAGETRLKANQERKLRNSSPIGYTKFCLGYDEYTCANGLTNHLECRTGDACEVDGRGKTMRLVDRAIGETSKVYLSSEHCCTSSRLAYKTPSLSISHGYELLPVESVKEFL